MARAGDAGLASALAAAASHSNGTGAAEPGQLVAASLRIPDFDPIEVYAAATAAGLEGVLWLRPSEEFALVGIGRTWAIEAAGLDRFAVVDSAWRELLEHARVERPGGVRGLGPLLLGGLGFSGRMPAGDDAWAPFGAASLVLPELIALRTGNAAWLSATTLGRRSPAELEATWAAVSQARPAAWQTGGAPVLTIEREVPPEPHWRRTVGLMAGAVGRGRLDKVVFARRADLAADRPLDLEAALRNLAAVAPESTTYAFNRAGSTFLGASPERLVRTEGCTYRTAAIAGSIGRGRDTGEDDALAAELFASEKEREEHAVVVRTIRRQLAPVSERIEVAPRPAVLQLRHVQHLVTEISGTLREERGLLALAGLLHPTPAVGGEPRDQALAMIDAWEGFDRGWYSGPVGWLGTGGDGELMVALRCGLVTGNRAALFAGCGIVAESDPAREWHESRIKMRVVSTALGQLVEEQ